MLIIGIGIGRSRKAVKISEKIDLDDMNKHFTNVNILKQNVKTDTINSISTISCPSPFYFSTVSAEDVKKHVLAIKSDATGSDQIGRKMILLSLIPILPVLCHIFNHSLSTNTYPNAWRHAIVIPIPKVSNPISFTDYRPISILPFLSKVLERIVHNQLSSFLSLNKILSPFQSGFRPGHSTVTALNKVNDDIRLGIDNQQVTILALLDFSNAFNTVDFDILLAVLKSINVSSEATEWFYSYLHEREQSIHINDKRSSVCRLSAGVPQGGVLSPLLFSIFINSITKLLSLSFHLYADDLQIYMTTDVNDIVKAIDLINFNLHTISTWSKSFGLSVNPKKSQVCILGNPKQLSKLNFPSLPPIIFDNCKLECSNTVKNLGIKVDSSLSWAPHICDLSRKVYYTIGRLKRWKYLLPTQTKISLAHSLLLPILDYADTCYLDLSQQLLNKLERLQNLFIRFIFGLKKFDHISQHRVRLQWLTVKDRRNLHTVTLLYSILFHPDTPFYLKERFSFLGSNSRLPLSLRSKSDNVLEIPLCRTQCYSKSFTVEAVKLWNALPREIRQSTSINIFKIRVKNYYLRKKYNI